MYKTTLFILGFVFFARVVFCQVDIKKDLTFNEVAISAATYGPQNTFLAIATADKIIHVLNAESYQEHSQLEGLSDKALSLDISPNGKLLAAGDKANRITLWNLETGKKISVLKGHKGPVYQVKFSPDNQFIASASSDNSLMIWNVASAKWVRTFTGHESAVNALDFSYDGRLLVSGSDDMTLKIWHAESGLLSYSRAFSKAIKAVVFNNDATLIGLAGEDKHINICDAVSGELVNTLFIHKESINSLCFSADGNYILSGGNDSLLMLTDLRTGLITYKSPIQPGRITSVGISSNGRTFLGLSEAARHLPILNAEKLPLKGKAPKESLRTSASLKSLPVIDWEATVNNNEVYEASLTMPINIHSASGLRSVEIFLNHELFSAKDRSELMLIGNENGVYQLNEVLVLKEGENTLQLKAKNVAGESISEIKKLFYINLPSKPLSWISPAQTKIETFSNSFELKALISPAPSKQNVKIYLNGVKQMPKIMPANGGILTQRIILRPGSNQLKIVIATDKFEKEAEERTLVFSTPKSPLVEWIAPAADTLSNISRAKIRASINSKIPIDKVMVMVNGITVYELPKTRDKWVHIDRQIDLMPGQNMLTLVAENSAGKTISPLRVISYGTTEKTSISWLSPGGDSLVYEPILNLSACIQSKSRVEQVELFINDKLVDTKKSPLTEKGGDCALSYAKRISLNPGENQLKIVAQNAGGNTVSEIRSIDYQVPALAKINWTSPLGDHVSVSESTMEIQACVESNSPLSAVTILLNNKIFLNLRNPEPMAGNCLFEINQTLPLQNGANTIILRAVNMSGDVMSTPLQVDYKTANPYRFALIFGNEDYSSYQSGLNSESDVDFAINDAKGFKQACLGNLNIKEENILYFENARYMDMKRGLGKMNTILKSTNGKAELFVYFAGHGFPDEETKEPYLIPVDASGTDLKFGGIKLTEFYALLTEHPAERITVFIDACFSGGARNQGLLAARGVKINPKKTEESIKKKLVVFTASSGTQSSLPYKEKEHGMFTYYLLKKIEETQGKISYDELSNYLKSEISIRSIMINGKEQEPQTNISPEIQDEWKSWKLN